MRNCALPALVAAVTTLCVGCASIPVNTPEQTLSVPYTTFVPGGAVGVSLPLLPAFNDIQAPAASFPVPAEAKQVKLETVNLSLKVKNSGALPLRMQLFLAKAGANVYGSNPLGAPDPILNLTPGGTVEKTFVIDPALLQADQLQLGTKFGSDGLQAPFTVKANDKLELTYKIGAQAKLF
jgi:hypothetical protein